MLDAKSAVPFIKDLLTSRSVAMGVGPGRRGQREQSSVLPYLSKKQPINRGLGAPAGQRREGVEERDKEMRPGGRDKSRLGAARGAMARGPSTDAAILAGQPKRQRGFDSRP